MDNQEQIEPRIEFLSEDPAMERHLTGLGRRGLRFPRELDRGPLTEARRNAKRLRMAKARRNHIFNNMKSRRSTDPNIRPVS